MLLSSLPPKFSIPPLKPTITYRPDIDGLRALAVLAVVLFHAYPRSILRGGFIGVDIFFVISGFLITSILISDLAQQRFSLARFYSHRIRRIFPALLLILTFCLVVGWFVLLGDEYQQLGKHIAGGAGFVSNLLFWQEAGYFDNSAETKPLLHLWSLGIEEQFYIFWPVLLWLIWKCKNYFRLLITGLALASFGWNIFHLHQYPTEVFYAPYTRFWELLIGSGLAYQSAYPSAVFKTLSRKCNITLKGHTLSDWMPNICSILGLVLILVGIFTIKQSSAFPGWYALLPTLGTAALIAGGPHSWVNKHIFSNRVLVGIGLISFPLYLWHWPLLSISRIITGETLSPEYRALMLATAFVLAILTKKLIEDPIRYKKHRLPVTTFLIASMMLVGIFGLSIYKNQGFQSARDGYFTVINKGDIGHDEFYQYLEKNFYPCTPESIYSQAKQLNLRHGDYVRCMQSKPNIPIEIALVGDSHAEHLFIGMAEAFKEKNVGFYLGLGLPLYNSPEFKDIYTEILSNKKIERVYISALWGPKFSRIYPNNPEQFQADLTETLKILNDSSINLYFIEDVTLINIDINKCSILRNMIPLARGDYKCTVNYGLLYHQHQASIEAVIKLFPNIKYIDPNTLLCDHNICLIAKDGYLLYRDDNHLGINGSKYVGRLFINAEYHYHETNAFISYISTQHSRRMRNSLISPDSSCHKS